MEDKTVYDILAADLFEVIECGCEEHKNDLEDLTKNLVHLCGWVRSNRDNGSVGFIDFNDGTSFRNIQIVYSSEQNEENTYLECKKMHRGAAIELVGRLVLTPENKQPFEIHVYDGKILADVADDYPLQKKFHTVEFLRSIAHLRVRSNLSSAIFKVRNSLSMAIHSFFQMNRFMYVHTPLITCNDAEGAGETFSVVTKDKDPAAFFGRPVVLTVTGQLHVEAFALAYRNVYTFGPTFRAEHSNTVRHASEFWMIEPEMSFADLNDNMNVIENCIRYCIGYVLDDCKDEMAFFNEHLDHDLIKRLEHVRDTNFKHITYTEAIKEIKKAIASGVKFDNPNIEWGDGLQSEHERYITEKVMKGPTFVTNYPKTMTAFYMRQNDDGKTVANCDLLVPYVGELVGGSQREERYDVLKARMEELGNLSGLEWYLELRKYGCPVHSGFGIGFDRFLMYLTGVNNIRDIQPFPRTSDPIKY